MGSPHGFTERSCEVMGVRGCGGRMGSRQQPQTLGNPSSPTNERPQPNATGRAPSSLGALREQRDARHAEPYQLPAAPEMADQSAALRSSLQQGIFLKKKAAPAVEEQAEGELHKAAEAGDLAQLERMLSRPINIDAHRAGKTALHVAAECGQIAAMALLVSKGASVCATTTDGWTALHCAAQSASAESTALLLARDADIHAATRILATPLHMAAFNGRLAVSKALLLRGADVHAQDKDGFTPLADAKYRSKSCPCAVEDAERKWGAVIALLEKVTP